jgi:SH3-like domain-containing protein
MTMAAGIHRAALITPLLAGAFIGLGAPGAEAAPVACKNLWVFEAGRNPPATIVYAGPSSKARRIGVIPKQENGNIIEIVASQNGWLLVANAVNVEDKVTFKGPGWVRASAMAVSLQQRDGRGTPLYAAPSKKAKILHWFPGGGDQYEAVMVSCKGGWAQVRLQRRRGWLARGNQCGLPWTTCP